MGEVFKQDACREAIRDVCDYFDDKELSMFERWWACLCIERAAEGIMADGLEEVADDLRKFRDDLSSA